jgi:hypothetical protein
LLNWLGFNVLITTTLGDIEECLLEKRTGWADNEIEATSWVEYYKDGDLVHRSAHVTLKQGHVAGMIAGVMG